MNGESADTLLSKRAESEDSAQESSGLGAAGEPCHVGLVFALPIESGYFQDLLQGRITIDGDGFRIHLGGMDGRRIGVAVTGPGQHAAERGTAAFIAGHRPAWVISAGFAGGLSSRLARFDLVMADRLVDERGGSLAIDLHVDRGELRRHPNVQVGTLLTLDRIARRPQEKRQLARQHEALAVDMETFAVAKACQEAKRKFLAVRIVTDPADEELPPDVERLLFKPGGARMIGAAAGSIVRRPSALKDLWRLRRTSHTAAERLAQFLAGVVRQLP